MQRQYSGTRKNAFGGRMKSYLIGVLAQILIVGAFSAGHFFGREGAYTNERIHTWAAKVIDHNFKDEKGGYYEVCLNIDAGRIKILDREKLIDITNACAIMKEGSEW
jgi:hypothetical protein